MSNLFTYTTEIKQTNDNQLLIKYISDFKCTIDCSLRI
jgi:hypothetical protein